jgi:hypothetical protein
MKITFATCLGFCVLGTLGLFSFLRHGEKFIEKSLLEETPLGASFEVVASKLTKHYGKIEKNPNAGFLCQDRPGSSLVGVKSIRVELGDYYHFPIGTTSVTAFWGFDKDGKLIKIWVWKTADSL